MDPLGVVGVLRGVFRVMFMVLVKVKVLTVAYQRHMHMHIAHGAKDKRT